MKLASTAVAVTGGGGGLGSAISRAAQARDAAELIVIDVDGAAAEAVAAEVGRHVERPHHEPDRHGLCGDQGGAALGRGVAGHDLR